MVRLTSKNPFLFCTIILVVYLIGLWGASVPLTGDQKVYLSIALEMFEKKEWIIPSLLGEPNFLKPPFQYWATILGWKVFGLSIFGALIPSIMALVSSAFLTFQLGKKIKLKSPELAAILFSSTLGSMTYGSTAQMEIWIVFFFLAAWFAVLSSRMFLAFALVGVMAWVKGPLYPILWTMSLLVWNLREIKTKKFWLALGIGTFIGLTWYFLAAKTHQQEMMKQFFYTENLGKISTQQGSVVGLWGEFFLSLFPWSIILVLGGLQKSTRENWKKNQKFYLSYSLVSAIFFTVFPYRVNSYLYFLTPIMAMMTSEIELGLSRQTKAIGLGIYSTFYLLLIVALFQLNRGGWIGIEVMISAIGATVIFMSGYVHARWKYVALGSLLLVNVFRISAVQIGERDVAGLREAIQQHPGEYAYYIESKDIWHEYGLMSSVIGHSVRRIYNKAELDSFLALGGSVILQEDQKIDFPQHIHCIDWQRLKRRTKFPLQKLFTEGVNWGNSEIMRNYHICAAAQ